jgi:hypothetical protein
MDSDETDERAQSIINLAASLQKDAPEIFDTVVRRLLTMLSQGTHNFMAEGTKLRPYGLAEGTITIPDSWFNGELDAIIQAEFEGTG